MWLILENLALLLQIYNKLFSFYFPILSVSSFSYDIVFNVLWADFCLNDMFSKNNHFWNWFIAITSKDQHNAGFSSVSMETGETSHLEVSHPCVHLNFWVSLFLTCVSILFVKAHKISKGYSGENEMICLHLSDMCLPSVSVWISKWSKEKSIYKLPINWVCYKQSTQQFLSIILCNE